MSEIGISQLQLEVGVWSQENFGEFRKPHVPLLGMIEETGELAETEEFIDPHLYVLFTTLGRLSHAHIKKEQGIRGNPELHQANKIDAVGDIMIYLADYCGQNGIDMAQAVTNTWNRVKQRNWKKNKVDGGNSEIR